VLTFLAVNGYELNASQDERADWILRLSAGLSIDELGQLIRGALTVPGPC
jgi:prophage maintenance system killer protein